MVISQPRCIATRQTHVWILPPLVTPGFHTVDAIRVKIGTMNPHAVIFEF